MTCVFTDAATAGIYTLSLHDALPISGASAFRGARVAKRSVPRGTSRSGSAASGPARTQLVAFAARRGLDCGDARSEEHTSELQSLAYLVCRLLLEKKKENLQIQPSLP